MSSGNVVDSKVVEMSFDNQNFESNAKTSLSTLEKLKQALNFSKDSKGIDDVNSKLGKLNLSTLADGVMSVKKSFGEIAREAVVFNTVSRMVDNMTTSLKNFVKSNTVDQISAGWERYADKTSAVQTIMAATAKDFTDTETQMATVNQQLGKLSWYTDETSAKFNDMVSTIGKFTSNSVSLEDSVTAMEGISNWAYISGANVNDMSRAMYNLSQAMAVGSVKLMDWKSIENANMATAEFKETALETAVALGTVTKEADGTFKTLQGHAVSVTNFNQQLSDGWFTSEVLLKTLDRYGGFTEKLYAAMENMSDSVNASMVLGYIDKYKDGTIDLGDAAKKCGVSVSELKGYLAELGSEDLAFGMKAFRAAQEAKTFQEAVDSVKEAVSSGWVETFEIMFGDYVKAKELWTTLAEDLYDIFATGGGTRNQLLREAFDTQTGITKEEWSNVTSTGIASPAYIHAIREAAAEHGHALDKMVSDEQWLAVALEKGYIRASDLSSAYESLGKATGKVDEELKKQVESTKETDEEVASLLSTIENYSGEDINKVVFGDGKVAEGYEDLEGAMDSLMKKFGLTQDQGEDFVNVLRSMGYFGGEVTQDLYSMSNEQLRSLGYSDDQIMKLRRMQKEGVKLKDVFGEIGKAHKSTGDLWTETLYNGLEILMELVGAVRETWAEMFPPTTANQITSFVESLHAGSERLLNFVKNSEELRTILRGIFAGFDIVLGVVKTLGKAGFAALRGFLQGLGIDFLDLGVKISNFIITFRNWLTENEVFSKIVSTISSVARGTGELIRGFIDAFLGLPIVSRNIERFKNAFGIFFKDFGPYMSEGIERVKAFIDRVKSLDHIGLDNIGDVFKDFKDNVLDYFLNFPGFKAIQGAFRGLLSDIGGVLSDIGAVIWEKLYNLREQFEGTFIGDIIDGVMNAILKIKDVINDVIHNGISLEGIGKTISGAFNAIFSFISNIDFGKILKIGLAVAPIALVIGVIRKLWGVIHGVPELLDGVKGAIDSVSGYFDAGALEKKASAFKSFAIAIGVLVAGIYVLTTLDQARMWEAVGVLAVLAAMMVAVMFAMSKIGKSSSAGFKMSITLVAIAASVAILVGALNTLSKMDDSNIIRNLLIIAGLLAAMTGVAILLSKFAPKMSKGGLGILLFVVALKMMVGVIQKIDELELKDPLKTLGILAAMIAGLVAISKLTQGTKLTNGLGIILIVVALKMLVGVVESLGEIEDDKLTKGLTALGIISLIIGALGYVLGQTQGIKLGSAASLVLVATAIIIMSAAMTMLADIDSTKLDGAMYAITLIGLIIAALGFVLGKTGSIKIRTGVSLVLVAASMVILAQAMTMLADINSKKLDGAMCAITLIGIIIGALAVVLQKKKIKISSAVSLVIVAAAIYVLVEAVKQLAALDEDALLRGVLALGIVMTLMGILAVVLDAVKINVLSVVLLGVLIAAVAIALYALCQLPADDVLTVAKALAISLLALAVTLGILAVVGNLAKEAMIGVLLLVAFIAVFALLGLGVSFIPDNIKKRIIDGLKTINEICEAIGEVFVTIAKYIGKALGAFLGSGIEEAFSHLGMIGKYLAEFTQSLQGVKSLSLDNLLGTIEALGLILATSIIGFADSILSIPSELMGGKTAAETVASDLEALANALVIWDDAMTRIDELDIPVAALAGLGITDLIANIEGFVGAILSLPAKLFFGKTAAELVASDIEELAEALTKWQEAMDKIGPDGITLDASGLLELGIVDVGTNLTGLLGSVLSIVPKLMFNESAVELVCEDITDLATALGTWQEKMGAFDEITIPQDGIDTLSGIIRDLSFTGLISACTSVISKAITGKRSVELVCEDITTLATALSTWQEKMGDFENITIPQKPIDDLASAIEDISTVGLKSALDNFLIDILGQGEGEEGTALGIFSKNVETLATSLGTWKSKMEEIGAITVPKTVLDNLITAIKEIPEQGLFDVISNFFPVDTDAEAFANDAEQLGSALQRFSNAFDVNVDADKLDILVKAAVDLASVSNDLAGYTYTDDLSDFANKIANLGPQLAKFAKDTDISESDLAKLSNISTVTALLSEACMNFSNMDLDSGDIADENIVDKFKQNIETVSDVIAGLVGLNTSGVDSLVKSVGKLSEADVSKALDKVSTPEAKVDMSASGEAMASSIGTGISNSTAITDALGSATSAAAKSINTDNFKAQGIKIIASLAAGVNSSTQLSSSVRTVVTTAASEANGYYQQFNDAGYNFAKGLANGMARGIIMAMAAARALALSVLNAAKNALQEASPSKAAEEIGMFFDLGLINGLMGLASRVGSAGGDVAEAAKTGLANAIKGVNDIISGGIDAQPVIAPVLDLTNIQNGASAINDLLGLNRPMGVLDNLNAIGRNVRERDLVSNNDILVALRNLQPVAAGGDTYIIEGVTYDDGSNISDAVRSIIRAARVERRS